ncbi:MAG: ABC transporter ATP-binding protein [Steroidobacteraceae bacterium]
MSITLDQVTKRYQALPVVNDVSFAVEPGEFLVLLGPSGSGKSTLLRAIAGLIEIDHGSVSLHGRDVTRVAARDRGVGFVFQHYALFRHMSVADNVEFALRVRRMRAADRRVRRDELLRLVTLEGMQDRLPGELSGGQQQRVAVARALAHRPEVLLLDEPFGALDARIREDLRRTIRAIQRELGITTILVTHDQDEAFAMADRIGVMHQGRLLELDTPTELYARPATRFVATFLGAANLLLAYRSRETVRFEYDADAQPPQREIVAVIRPEELILSGDETSADMTRVGSGVVEELQFAGATARLRVRMPAQGPMPATPDRVAADGSWILDALRTFPQQRVQPFAVGQRVEVAARRMHLLPTPISSFTVVADDDNAATGIARVPLLATLAARMQCRIGRRIRGGGLLPPGLPVLGGRPGVTEDALQLLEQGATQLLVLPPQAKPPTRILILPGTHSRPAAIGAAASLLRHFPAQSVLLAVHPAATPERERGSRLRELLDLRSAALGEHGLDLRTELRFGELETEVARELAVDPDTLIVLGVDGAESGVAPALAEMLEGGQSRPILFVRSAAAER